MPERINGQLTHDIMQELQADKAKINHIKYGKITIHIQDGKLVRIERALETQPQVIYLIDCPLCQDDPPGQMELDPRSGTYWCGDCGRDGTLQSLLGVAEGLFALKHRESLDLMTTRPRVERGGTKGGRMRQVRHV